jgi:GxxExxY protein
MPQRLEDIKNHEEEFLPLTREEEIIGKAIISAAYIVHKNLGPGLLERVYEVCFSHVLTKEGYFVERQVDVPIVFDGIFFEEGLRLDVLVNERLFAN